MGQSLSTCQGERMVLVLLISVCALAARVAGGLLGAGTGPGSCSAPPFRADSLAWPAGCPAYAEVIYNVLFFINHLSIVYYI